MSMKDDSPEYECTKNRIIMHYYGRIAGSRQI